MGKGYMLVEGHGEVAAAGNLITRLWADLGYWTPWAEPIRWKNLNNRSGVEAAARVVRAKGDVDALLLLRDEDDACPRTRGPEVAAWLAALRLPFPVGVVLLHREYEVLFLPCLPLMAGRPLSGPTGDRPGLQPGTRYDGDWEAVRGVKEWLGRRFLGQRTYKPTLDQLPLTRMIDFETLRAAAVPCFGTLERALRFLGDGAGPGEVYPKG